MKQENTSRKKSLLGACALVSFIAIGCTAQQDPNRTPEPPPPPLFSTTASTRALRPTTTIELNGQRLHLESATTPEEQALGLGSISFLSSNEGMLFPFNPPTEPTFWMKGMRFPIDILWVRNGKIVGIEHMVPPPLPGQTDSELTQYTPPSPIDSVIELKGGWAKEHKLLVGNEVK